jgi:hypothetical protein
MSDRRSVRRWTALGSAVVAVVLAGVLAGTVVASKIDDGSELIAAIDEAPLTRVADIEASEGERALGVFVQRTRTGHLCVWEAPSATSRERGGGCNSIDDPLGGSTLSATLSYDGGPSISDVRSASIFGLTAADVSRLRVQMGDGTFREVKLKKTKVGSEEFRAFGYRFKTGDLKKGLGPTAIVAYDAAGNELGRQTTGIGT